MIYYCMNLCFESVLDQQGNFESVLTHSTNLPPKIILYTPSSLATKQASNAALASAQIGEFTDSLEFLLKTSFLPITANTKRDSHT